MSITRIRYFVEVARCLSFSEAARRLYTAQPNLSKQIAQMEQELGFPLFVRSHRTVKLTQAGEYLYDKLKDLPEQLDEYFSRAREMAEKGDEGIIIGVLEGQDVNLVLRERLARIQERFPRINVALERNSYQNLRSGLESGHYDLIITLSFDVEDDARFRVYRLYEKSPAIAMHRSHPLAKKVDLDLIDLKDEPFVVISREESPGGYQKLIDSCSAAGFQPRIVREPRSLESLLLCVEMGMGVALLDQNTRLVLSPDIITIPQNAEPMAVVAATVKRELRTVVQQTVEILARQEEADEDK
ncbi:MAG: LysR family transcriptional regulator [Oscillospiraceae bacterium]|nr:LysR family transcriptional regulator [Oscillospiraceae bacterium]